VSKHLGVVDKCFQAAGGDAHLALGLAVMLVRLGLYPGLPAIRPTP